MESLAQSPHTWMRRILKDEMNQCFLTKGSNDQLNYHPKELSENNFNGQKVARGQAT